MDLIVEDGLPSGALTPLTEELIAKIKDLVSKKVSQHKIAKMTDLHRSRVRAILSGNHVRGVGGSSYQKEKWQKVREEEYRRGLASTPSTIDSLCVGLYLGEGSWYDEIWNFVNSNRQYVSLMRDWAIRAGQNSTAFRAKVQVNTNVDYDDLVIRHYWAEAGIPTDNITVYRITSKSSKGKMEHKIPYGTCNLSPQGNGLRLFEYLRGQRDKLLGT